MSKKLILHSGGMDSLANILSYMNEFGPDNIISLGFNYGQRHFEMENRAAQSFCDWAEIQRIVLDVPIGQIGGCSLVDHDIPVTTNMAEQRSTVVPNRNMIFLSLAAAVAQVNDCDTIVHGACKEDYEAYRDCRDEFFRLTEMAIQAAITNPVKGDEKLKFNKIDNNGEVVVTGASKLDIQIETPLVFEKKEETMARILKTYPSDIYKYSYSCYNGGAIQCGRCPACVERQVAFYVNGVKDPLEYVDPLTEEELKELVATAQSANA